MIGLLIGIAIGVVLGTVSGLIPGVHANTMAGVLLGLQAGVLSWVGSEVLAAALFAALITHTFLDIIPSTFLGVPSPDTAVSVLPAHALCLEGKGEEAVRIAALGSAAAAVIAIPLSVALFCFIPLLQPFIDWWIGILIIAVAGYLIVTGESPAWSLAVFLVSGLLGIFTLRFTYVGWHTLGASGVLMPLLAGLFGISVLLLASSGPVPEQRFSGIRMGGREIRKGAVIGTIAGTIVGWLPGLSNATANAVLASTSGYERDRRGYILATSAANTANAIIGIAVLYAIARMRNGVMVAMAAIEPPPLPAMLAVGGIAACLAFLITIRLSSYARLLNGIDSRHLNLGVTGFITVLCFLISGPFGLLILLLAFLVGIVPPMVNIPRVYCMGAIMLPVLCYSFGIAVT
jgi:putative membrane protein